MKKLFAFVMAMVITTMAFGQIIKSLDPGARPIQDSQDERTGWIGGSDSYDVLLKLKEGERFCMRLPASGALPVGDNLTVTKVAFRWQPEYLDGTPMDNRFRILIFAGGNSDWIQEGQNVSKTMDTTVQGTLLHEQYCECERIGWQTVEMSHPVAIPSDQEIWIAVQALGLSCCLVDPDFEKLHPEWWGQHLLFSIVPTPENPDGYWWHTAAFNGGNETVIPGKFGLRVLIDNGEPHTNSTDWIVNMYSLETLESTTPITRLYVDQYMMDDSLYLFPEPMNLGPDINASDGKVRMYIPNTDIVFLDKNYSEVHPEGVDMDITVGPYSGYIFYWLDGLMAYRDMESLGLTFPFYVCCTFETYGYDPNLTNNTACVKVTDREDDDDDPGVLVVSKDFTGLHISPNPANTHIKVENAAGSRITIYNIAGQEVMSVAYAEANETLNVSDLKAGLYIVRVANGNEVSTAKVSIVR